MTEEKWREIPGHPDYDVSNLGRVRSWRGNRWHRASEPRVLKTPLDPAGYPRVHLLGIVRLVHHVVLEAFVGPRPLGKQGAHINGNPADARLINLAWKTPKENSDDKYLHGTVQFGEAHHNASLTAEAVADIREIWGAGMTYREIASIYGVRPGTIGNVIRGATWTSVPSESIR